MALGFIYLSKEDQLDLEYRNVPRSNSDFLCSASLLRFFISLCCFPLCDFRVPETEFVKAYKSNPRLRTKVNNFHRQASSSNDNDDENLPIRPDWTSVDRIIACRFIDLLDSLDA